MIDKITYMDIMQYKKEAEKASLTFCSQTEYYGIRKDGKVIAFAGLLKTGAKKIVIKNIYVLPSERGKGHFKKLLDYFMVLTVGNLLEANCTPMSVNGFLSKGFYPVQSYKNGVIKVRYENIPKE